MNHIIQSIIAAALFCVVVPAAQAQRLLLANAQIVDPVSRTIHPGAISINDGKIVDVLGTTPSEFNGTVVDLGGKYVIPGLNDMHVHSFGNLAPGNQMQYLGPVDAARVMLYCGVTGFLDLFSPEDQIFAARDRQRSAGMLGADIFCAGPILTCTGGHGTEYGMPTRIINTPADAVREVTSLAARHPDVVKIVYDHAFTMPTISQPTLIAAIKTAKEQGLKTVIHIGTWEDARQAIEAGATCITHVYLGDVIPDSLVQLMRDQHVYEIPTMTVESDLANMYRDSALLGRPLMADVVPAALRNAYRDSSKLDTRLKPFLHWQMSGNRSLMNSVEKMSTAGVHLLAGTDAGNPGTFQGYSLHRELELMGTAGMNAWDVLASATTTAGDFLGRDFRIAPGAVANLDVLDASPIDNIANTQKIAMVIYHGVVVDRQELLHPKGKEWTATLIDDFSRSTMTGPTGAEWHVDLDSTWGGHSTLKSEYRDGMLHVWGKLQPKSGMPGLAGISMQFDTSGGAYDLSRYTGVRLHIKSSKGPLALKMLTSSVHNYDYHMAFIQTKGDVQQIDIPFASLKQLWSAPLPWSGKDVQGIAFWASAQGATDYDFTVDSVELY